MPFQRAVVIMAGGSGERFWPFSRLHKPKQMLKLASTDQTLLEQAIDRAQQFVSEDQVYIATAPHLVEPIQSAGLSVKDENIIAEPYKRNTAGALIWVAATLMAKHPDQHKNLSLAVITADHDVKPVDGFVRTMDAALTVAEATGGLATIGIPPTRPETGYGYIETSNKEVREHSQIKVQSVQQFREKPTLDKAQIYVASGNYLWNSGTFFWTLEAFLRELATAAPDLHQACLDITEHLLNNRTAEANAVFEGIRNISIDFALMEQASNVFVAHAAFDWDDIGSWDSLERSLPSDDDGNVIQGEALVVNGTGNIILSSEPGTIVTTYGVDGLVIAVTKDAVLVIPKKNAQEVKRVVEALKANSDSRL